MNKERKYPVGSIGYYKEMTSYRTPEHLRDDYIPTIKESGNYKFNPAIRIKPTKFIK